MIWWYVTAAACLQLIDDVTAVLHSCTTVCGRWSTQWTSSGCLLIRWSYNELQCWSNSWASATLLLPVEECQNSGRSSGCLLIHWHYNELQCWSNSWASATLLLPVEECQNSGQVLVVCWFTGAIMNFSGEVTTVLQYCTTSAIQDRQNSGRILVVYWFFVAQQWTQQLIT